jgi:hypothetical protein
LNKELEMAKECPIEINIDGTRYVRADTMDAYGDYVIVRSRDAGVHAGHLMARVGDEVALANSRRLWKWQGALTLSELSLTGPVKPGECKFAATLPDITIIGACEVIPCTRMSMDAIKAVPEWK